MLLIIMLHMEQITETPVGVRRVRMSEQQQIDALQAYSLRNADLSLYAPKITRNITPKKTSVPTVEARPSRAKRKKDAVKAVTKTQGKKTKALVKKASRTVSLDEDVLAFFTAGGRGTSSRINAILRSIVDAARDIAVHSAQLV